MNTNIRFSTIALLTIVILSCFFTAGCLRESVLSVRGMTVGADKVDPARVVLNVTTEVENYEGFASGTPVIQLRAFSTETGILETERTDPLPGIGWGGSGMIMQTLDLPRKGSYRLVATVYEGDRRKAQGEITVYSLDRLVPDSQQSGIAIGDIDFIARKVDGGSVDLQADLYLRNDDPAPSGPFEMEVKAKEMDAHLVADKKTVHVENIDSGRIVVVSVPLTVPDQYNYVMEVLIWRDGTIIQRGEGTVQLRPGTALPAGDQFVTKKIETSKFVSEQAPSPVGVYPPVTKTPGFTGLVALIGLAVAGGIALAWRRRR